MPVLNEFYVNFGKLGVIFGMFLIGFIFSLLTKLFTFKNNLNVESILSFYLLYPYSFRKSLVYSFWSYSIYFSFN